MILHGVIFMRSGMLSVKSMLDNSMSINVIQDPICILYHQIKLTSAYIRHSRCENNKFIVSTKFTEEFDSSRSDQVVPLFIFILSFIITFKMYESFIKIKDKSVNLLAFSCF